jgi:hypothetical protein
MHLVWLILEKNKHVLLTKNKKKNKSDTSPFVWRGHFCLVNHYMLYKNLFDFNQFHNDYAIDLLRKIFKAQKKFYPLALNVSRGRSVISTENFFSAD